MQVAESLMSDRLLGPSSIQPNHYSFLQERVIGVSRWASETRTRLAAHAAHDNTIILKVSRETGRVPRRIDSQVQRSEQGSVCHNLVRLCVGRISEGGFVRLGALAADRPQTDSPGTGWNPPTGIVYIADASKLSFSLRASICD
jgi:hypothetical protein